MCLMSADHRFYLPKNLSATSQERELAELESSLQDSSPDPTSPKRDFSP